MLKAKNLKLYLPIIIVLIAGLVFKAFSLFAAQYHSNYTSDDVSWQTILMTWRPFSSQVAYVGANDNFITNMPFIWLIDNVISPGRAQLFIEALSLSLLNFIVFFFTSLYFLRKCLIPRNYKHLLPYIWLASLSVGFSTLLLNTNWRDFEIGISFFYYMMAFKYYYGEFEPLKTWVSRLGTLVLLGVAILFTYSDPYFFIFTLLPIFILYLGAFVLKKLPWSKLAVVDVFALLSLAGARVTTAAIARVGILAPRGSLSPSSIGLLHTTFVNTYNAVSSVFGINFSQHIFLSITTFILLALVLIFSIKVIFSLRSSIWNATGRFFALLGTLVILGYIAIDNARPGDDRYLILLAYTTVMMSILFIEKSHRLIQYAFITLLAITIILNLQLSYDQINSKFPASNSENYKLISEVKKLGLNKGYANYWDGDINTYLSGGHISFLPIVCHEGKTIPLPLLANGSLFTRLANKSFYIYGNISQQPRTCDYRKVTQQFGQPKEVKEFDSYKILIYNYDIYTKMRPLDIHN